MLALSALQFTYTFPPSSYLNVVQQLSVTSFVLFGLVRRSLGAAFFWTIHTWSHEVAHQVTLHVPACQKQMPVVRLALEMFTSADQASCMHDVGSGAGSPCPGCPCC